MAESTFKLYSKRRRSRALLAQASLGVLIVALLFGISYAAVRIIYGQPLLRACRRVRRAAGTARRGPRAGACTGKPAACAVRDSGRIRAGVEHRNPLWSARWMPM